MYTKSTNLTNISYIIISFLIGVSLQQLCIFSSDTIYSSGKYFNVYSISALTVSIYTLHLLNTWSTDWLNLLNDKTKKDSLVIFKGRKATFIFLTLLLFYYVANFLVYNSFTNFLLSNHTSTHYLDFENSIFSDSLGLNILLIALFFVITFVSRIARLNYMLICFLFVATYYKSFIAYKETYSISDNFENTHNSILISFSIFFLLTLYIFLKSIIEFLIKENCFSDWKIIRLDIKYLTHIKVLLVFMLSKLALFLGIYTSFLN